MRASQLKSRLILVNYAQFLFVGLSVLWFVSLEMNDKNKQPTFHPGFLAIMFLASLISLLAIRQNNSSLTRIYCLLCCLIFLALSVTVWEHSRPALSSLEDFLSWDHILQLSTICFGCVTHALAAWWSFWLLAGRILRVCLSLSRLLLFFLSPCFCVTAWAESQVTHYRRD